MKSRILDCGMDLDETREGKKRTKAVDKVKRQRLVWSGLVERLMHRMGPELWVSRNRQF